MKKNILLIIFAMLSGTVYSQSYTGNILHGNSGEPVEYVSIGIVGRDLGTVSDKDGTFVLDIDTQYDQDTIRFSCIGYEPFVMKVQDFKARTSDSIFLTPKDFSIDEITVIPRIYEDKVLGNKFKGKMIHVGFQENKKGFEMGVQIKVKKQAILEKLTCNIASCDYDSVFYRVNVYKALPDNEFENVLNNPIYIKSDIDPDTKSLEIDLKPYDIAVEGNTLITLEHIADMGEGHLYFSGGLIGSTCYYRKTSQGNWSKVPVKLGMNVKAKVEK